MNWTTLLLILVPWTGAFAAQDVRYERIGDDYYRIDARGSFRVDPEILSVKFANGVADYRDFCRLLDDKESLLGQLEVVRKNRLGTFDLRVPAGADVIEIVSALRRTGLVARSEENVFGSFLDIPNDPFFDSQVHLRNRGLTGSTADADIDADLAWNFTTGHKSIVIATLDSGCQVTHTDLDGAIWVNTGEIPGNGLDDDGNGFVDDVNGWNFELGSPDLTDAVSHGTGVAGVIGARTNNGFGVAGVAGGFGVGPGVAVMPIKLATAVISTAIVDDAILYAVDNGARVINMSFEVPATAAIDAALDMARDVHGVLLVAASGNSLSPVVYPASHPKVLAVGGTDDEDGHWSVSVSDGASFGPEIWISASADTVWTTGVGDTIVGQSGTSFAAPQVAAAAGLMLTVMPSLDPDDLSEILKQTADDIDAPGFDEFTGWGRLNLYAAVLHVATSDCNGNGLYDPHEIAEGVASDVDGDGVPDDCDYSSFCFGNDDGSVCTACPCGNSAPSGARAGCENASGSSCALLVSGAPSVSADTLRFEIEGALPNSIAILCSANNALPKNGACPSGSGIVSPLHDGLRCVGGGLRRHGARSLDNTGEAVAPWDATSGPIGGLVMDGAFTAGQVRNFQVFYMDEPSSGCGTGLNTSNAVRVEFRP